MEIIKRYNFLPMNSLYVIYHNGISLFDDPKYAGEQKCVPVIRPTAYIK